MTHPMPHPGSQRDAVFEFLVRTTAHGGAASSGGSRRLTGKLTGRNSRQQVHASLPGITPIALEAATRSLERPTPSSSSTLATQSLVTESQTIWKAN